jgi:hypothetical protein
MSDDLDAAIEAASRAIEAMPHRDYPNMVDTTAWGPAAAETITVSYQRADLGPTPVPQELPAGWATVDQLKAQLAGRASDMPVNPA